MMETKMRSMILAGMLLSVLAFDGARASSGDLQDTRPRDLRGKLCVNCQPASEAPASRLAPDARVATKLVAPNTCADPGAGTWFAEEEDHLTAFLNATAPQFK
jgi:hypothetical protein